MGINRIALIMLVLALLAFQVHSQESPSVVATDPAIAEMEASLDMPRPSATQGAVTSTPATSTPAATTPPVSSAAGSWHLMLSGGPSMDTSLIQSGAVLFGRANITTGSDLQWATASGSVSGSIMRLDIVPSSGEELYALTLDLSRVPLSGTYLAFRGAGAPIQGTATASRASAQP